ncbi:MAG: enoyl-CoA hydratase-related protein [Burkholderiales bacterium]|nr:enoyl-CoA hydratase-related protein [Burkholderiales bacterium]
MNEATLYEVRQGAAWITLNRPQNRNALSAVLVNELDAHLAGALEDPAVRCIVITGTDPAFCAGADLKNPPGQSSDGERAVSLPEVLGAADIVITAEDVPYSFSEVRIGVIPAVISVVCLPKLGTHHGMKLFLTGERFTGAQAVQMGFAHRAVPREQLHAAVQEEIDAICLGGPIAVAECKKLVRRVPQLSTDEGFAEMAVWSRRMFGTPEAAEGMSAFREKRKPGWVTGG